MEFTAKALLEKAGSSVLSGAGGAGVKLIFNLIFEGTTDPAAEKLSQISSQLSELKTGIKNLPEATAIYGTYYQSVYQATSEVLSIHELLYYSKERQELYGTYQDYLLSLRKEHWRKLIDFLSVSLGSDYVTLINQVLRAAYGLKIRDIYEAPSGVQISFGEAEKSYARTLQIGLLDKGNIPIALREYVEEHLAVRNTVLTAVTGIVMAGKLVFETLGSLQSLASGTGSLKDKFDPEIWASIIERTENKEVVRNLKELQSGLLQKLLPALLSAPAYLGGNAYRIYMAIQAKEKCSVKNLATKSFMALSGPEGFSLKNKIAGDCDYWSMKFFSEPVGWKFEFVPQQSEVTLTGNNGGYVYTADMHNPNFYNVYTSPSQQDFGEKAWGKNSYTWDLKVVPKAGVTTGAGEFVFVLINVRYGKALVNEIPVIGKSNIGVYKLDKYDGNHQWEILSLKA